MTKEKSKISKEEVRIGQEELSGLEANILDKPQQVPHVRLLNKKYEELEENR